jgi:hypothetical protein
MPKELNVESVKAYLQSQDIQVVYALQQTLEWFGVGEKLERIVWAMLKRLELDNKRAAELAVYRFQKASGDKTEVEEDTLPEEQEPGPTRTEPIDITKELPPLVTVVGLCPKCGSPLYGEPVPPCERKITNRVFYKECGGCSYYVEVIKRRNNYLEIEGGE